MNKEQLQVINSFINLSDSEKSEVLNYLNNLKTKTFTEQIFEKSLISERLSRVGPTNTICPRCGK